MGPFTTSSSSSQSSGGHCQCDDKCTDKFEHLSLHHTPPPPPIHSRAEKHHHKRPHYCPPPPHPCHHVLEHPDHSPPMDCPHHHDRPPMVCIHQLHPKKVQLRVNPPKHSKKVYKLHHKLMKAYKLPKSPRHGGHHHHHMHLPPPKKGFFSTHFGHHHPPGCCLHSMEEERFPMEGLCRPHEMRVLHHHHQCHGGHLHPPCYPRHSQLKSEVVGAEVALASPRGVEASAEQPTEGGSMALAYNMPPANEPALVMLAP